MSPHFVKPNASGPPLHCLVCFNKDLHVPRRLWLNLTGFCIPRIPGIMLSLLPTQEFERYMYSNVTHHYLDNAIHHVVNRS